MKRILIFCYLILFVAVIISGTLYYEERPLLIIISSNVIFGLVAITILMYGLSYKPKRFVWFWKIVPILLVAYFISLRYLAGPSYVGTEGSLGSLLLLILAIIASFFPAFYLSFKFGYYKVLPAGKFNPKFAGLILVITSLCVASRYFPLNKDRINIKVNYVAEYNKITKPANFDPNQNAAPYYQKAFDALVSAPNGVDDLRRIRPVDMNNSQVEFLEGWLESNSEALGYLKQAVQKPYYWIQIHSQDNSLGHTDFFSNLPKFHEAVYCLRFQSKLHVVQGQMDQAIENMLSLEKMAAHLYNSNTLVSHLVAMAVDGLATQIAFEILDNTKIDSKTLADFQSRFEQSSQIQKPFSFEGEKIFAYDAIQQVFTDDGKGNGRLIPHKLFSYLGYPKILCGVYSKPRLYFTIAGIYLKTLLFSCNHPTRRETVELVEEVYELLEELVKKTPWELHQKRTSHEEQIQKLTKSNYFVRTCHGFQGNVCQIYQRIQANAEALIATIAILRYKADNGTLPLHLQELVSAGYLSELPMDPFGPGPLTYTRVTEDNFTLYSFGADFDDDGGTRSKWDGRGKEGGDQVFWPVKP